MSAAGERPPSWLQARHPEPVLRPADRRIETVYIAVAVALAVGAVLCGYVALGGRL